MNVILHQKGQSVIEFATLLVLVAIVVLVALSLLGVSISDAFENINNSI